MLFGPSNSIILLYDFVTEEQIEQIEQELVEAKKYYKNVLLSELVEKQEEGRARGYFSIAVKQARKNFQLRLLPVIQRLELSCTLFIQPECVGTNRLPFQEELSLYEREYADTLGIEQVQNWRQTALNEPHLVENLYLELREKVGPLPVHLVNPEQFYLTWGKIVDLNPNFFEVGLNLPSPSSEWLKESKIFSERQLNRKISLAYTNLAVHPTQAQMQAQGIKGLLTERVAEIKKGENVFNLPQWKFST